MPEVITLNNPLRKYEREMIHIDQGVSVQNIVKEYANNEEVLTYINGNEITEEYRATRILRDNEFLLIVPKVAGEDEGKTILNVALMIGVVLTAGALTSNLTYFNVLGIPLGVTALKVGLIIGGAMLISGLQPTPKEPSSGFIDAEQSQSFGWEPATLQRQGIACPRVYGLNRIYGNIISAHTEKETRTFTEVTKDKFYWYSRKQMRQTGEFGEWRTVVKRRIFDPQKVDLALLVDLGIGPFREPIVANSLMLNDEPVENLSAVYWEYRYGNVIQQVISYFDPTKLEIVVNRLVSSTSAVTYTTENKNFNDLEVELSFPKGLFNGSGGDLANYTVNVTIEIKKTTALIWTKLADNEAITYNVGNKVIETWIASDEGFSVEYGYNYDIRVTKETADRNNIEYGDELYLDKVREIIDHPFTYPRHALVGIKAQATNQLSASIRFSCLSRGLYVRVYDGASWNIEYSNNPAWVIYDILTQPVYTGSHSPWIDMKLLLNFEGADGATSTIDDSPKGHDITFGGSAELDTATDKFGLASLLLEGTDSYLQITNDEESFDICKNVVENWTIDFFVKHTDHAGSEQYLTQYEDANNRWYIARADGVGILFRVYIGGVLKIDMIGTDISDTNWHHIAMCKVSDEYGLYLDGTQTAYVQDTDTDIFAGDLYIGQKGDNTNWLDGNIDHLRIIKSNIFSAAPNSTPDDTITVPTVAYTDPGNTYAVSRYDGYNPSKLLTADFEDLADWCDDAEVNPINFTISSISLATNAVITTTSNHNFKVGDTILFRNVDDYGMVEIPDGTIATILKITDDTTFTVDLDTSGYTTFVGESWLEVDGSHYHSSCGYTVGLPPSGALNGTSYWSHLTNETHWLIVNLGQTYNIKKVRGRSNASDAYDPIDIDIYVSNDTGAWGVAVASAVATWQDTDVWQEVDTTDKEGQYIKIEIQDTEDVNKWLVFGNNASPFKIFDVFIVYSTATVEVYQPRFAFNGIFDTETTMWDAALSVCELCRCVPFFDGDKIRLAIDKAGSSVYAFTMGNIIRDSFQQKFIPIAERASEIEVHYRDKTRNYERTPFSLINPSLSNTSAKTRLDMFGITDTDMANRLADFKLLQNLYIKQLAIWQADIESLSITIGDIVDVQHDVTNWGNIGSDDDAYTGGGRIIAATNETNAVITIDGQIQLDDADFAGGSTTYALLLKPNTDASPESKVITAITESAVVHGTFDITVSGTYTVYPQKDDVWAIGEQNYETKKFRVINISRTEDNKAEITGIEYNSAIYAND